MAQEAKQEGETVCAGGGGQVNLQLGAAAAGDRRRSSDSELRHPSRQVLPTVAA